MCVHVSICTPTLFGKWGFIWDVCFIVLYPLTAHQKKACCFFFTPVIIQNGLGKFEGNLFCFYCSHPDCLKLPHAEKQKWKCLTLSLSRPTISFQVDLGLNGHLCIGLLSLSLSSEGAVSSVIQSPPLFPQTPPPTPPQFPLASHHTHNPPWRSGAVGQDRGDRGYLEVFLWRPHPKAEGGALRNAIQNTTGVGCLCVWGRVHFFN